MNDLKRFKGKEIEIWVGEIDLDDGLEVLITGIVKKVKRKWVVVENKDNEIMWVNTRKIVYLLEKEILHVKTKEKEDVENEI